MKPSLILVGLGNHGTQYENTRHNAGYRAVDQLSKEFGVGEWSEKPKFLSQIQEGRIVTVPVLLVKPETYMNRSGEAIQKILDFYKLDPFKNLIVFCDDVDLPLGEVRLREKGGPGTHNGLKSVIDYFGEGFTRIRIGLGEQPAGADLAAWVLSTLTKEEAGTIDKSINDIPKMVEEFVMGSKD